MTATTPVHQLQPAAIRVRDPISSRSIWLAGMIKNITTDQDTLVFDLIFLPEHDRDQRRSIEKDLISNLNELGVTDLRITTKLKDDHKPKTKSPVRGMEGGGMAPHGGAIEKKELKGVTHVIAVSSGKGGVGKSTLSTNLAVALKKLGHSVGLLDCDVYGPSIPLMMNVKSRPTADAEGNLIPVVAHGVKCISLGLFVDPEEAIIWRGPMVMGAIRQFIQQTSWGGVDYLIIDLPPGTGDAQLTLIKAVTIASAIIISTPQPVALADAIRGIAMFQQLKVPLLGLVENMAYYELPDGTRDYIFGEGGGQKTADRFNTPLLAQLPLRSAIRACGDTGEPIALGDSPTAQIFADIAAAVVHKHPPVPA
jgi:ATP-binding protein involved in chromosome partitioning